MKTGRPRRKLAALVIVPLLCVAMSACDTLPRVLNDSIRAQSSASSPTRTPKPTLTQTPEPTPEATHEPVPSAAGPILSRAFDHIPFSLLDGRLLIQMPVGSVDEARQRDIMSATPSSRAETRLVLNGDGQELVVYTQEAFYYTSNLEKDIGVILKQRYGSGFDYSLETVARTDGLREICYTPTSLDASGDSVLIKGAAVAFDDGSFVTTGVYVTPETLQDKALSQNAADKILKSITPGTRKLDVSAHEQRLGENIIYIKLDEGYTVIQDEGVDFSVFYLAKYVKLGEKAPSIGIYIGSYPSPMYKQRGIDESTLTKTKDTILNRSAEWLSYPYSSGGQTYSAETFVTLNSTLIMHIFVDAPNEQEYLKTKKMIDTMVTK